jgi:hypothetical protein
MSEVTKDKAFDRAVDLVINQDHVIQQWTGRFIAVQTSLAVAAAALISWKGPQLGFIVVILAVLIGGIAIILTHAMTQIIKREYEWQKKYVEMVKRTEEKEPLLYQDELLPGKDIPSIFKQIKPWIIGAWVIVILLVVLPFVLSATKAVFGC